MKSTSKHRLINKNQSGMASIIVTMIIMIVISLIVLATARLARREQRQSLDRQLNTQAYYAAESGVNDAVKALSDTPALLASDFTTNCSDFMAAANLTNTILDAASNVKYSCLLVDPTPPTWESNVGDTSRTIPIRDKNDNAISFIEIDWQDKSGSNDFSNCSATTDNLPPLGSWSTSGCNTPVIRFDLVPTNSVKRSDLNNSTMTGFLFPSDGGPGTTDVPYSAAGPIKKLVKCNKNESPKFCRAIISGLSANSYYLRIKSIYGNASVVISGQNASNVKYELRGAQAIVDSTGIANDILRRIQVRIPLSGASDIPEFAIQSGDNICKLLQVDEPTSTATSQDTVECPLN